MNDKISIGTFDCSEEDVKSVSNAMESGYLSTGPELKQFEKEVASYYGKNFGLMVNSGQSALEVALMIAKKKLNKRILKVIVPTTTYAATLWAITNTGCVPVFCDIGQDYNIGPNLLDREYEDADVLLTVDLCGKTCFIPESVKDKYFVIEDACEAFGNKNCNYGDIICFSFYVSHIITTGSGGMLIFDDKEDLDYAKSYISHGRALGEDFTEHFDKWENKFYFDKIGSSYRSDNLSASLGLSQFKRLDKIIEKRKENAATLIERYNESETLKDNYRFPSLEYWEDCVFQFFPILIKKDSYVNRESLLEFLYKKGIGSRVLLSLTNQPIVRSIFGEIEKDYPMSEYCNSNGFILGCHQKLTKEDMHYIIESLEEYDSCI
jgi:perosamine synthetase